MKKVFFMLLIASLLLMGANSALAGEEVITVLIQPWIMDEVLPPAIELFNERYDGQYRLDINSSADLSSEAMMQFLSGQAFYDVVMLHSNWSEWNRFLAPMDELIEASDVFDLEEIAGVDPFVYDGIRALPFRYGAGVFAYRKDLFDEAGIPYISEDTSWQDIYDYAQKLTVRDDNGKVITYGIGLMAHDLWRAVGIINEMYIGSGGSYVAPCGTKADEGLKSDRAASQFELLRELAMGDFSPYPIDFGTEELWRAMGEGKIAMAPVVYNPYASIFEAPDSESRGKLGYAAPPIHPRGPGNLKAWIGAWAMGIDANSNNKEAAFKFIELLVSNEAQLLMALEGNNGPSNLQVYENAEFMELNPVSEAMNVIMEREEIPEFPYELEGGQEWVIKVRDALQDFLLDISITGKDFGSTLYDLVNEHL